MLNCCMLYFSVMGFESTVYGVGEGGTGVFEGTGVSEGSGTGVSVAGSGTVAVPVIVEITIAVLVGFGVRVAVGNTSGRLGSSRCFVAVLVGGIVGVRVFVGVNVGVAVSVNVAVLVGVELGGIASCWNASAVNAAAVLRFENARLAMFAGSITIGVGRLGSESAIAEVAQNKLTPNAPAKKIHKSPA